MISFERIPGAFQLKTVQDFPAGRGELWDFISRPENLKKITPESMGFEIKTKIDREYAYAGQIIGYHVYPFPGVKTDWITEITQVEQGEFFIDEQRLGPYAIWHHEHRLEEIDGGIRMSDIVTYRPPFGILGKLMEPILVRPKLKKIFQHREEKLTEIFGSISNRKAA
jgi:ligand-binding SRPBCC domain-containing protein